MRVWLDFSNSPHPLLFAPVARRLEELGHDVVVTARDNAQTLELARERWPAVAAVDGASPTGRAAKATAIVRRAAALRRWAQRARPDVALSHNSYAQIVAARSLGMPVVTAMDYEHQPANHLAFRLARTILLPSAMPAGVVRRQGARGGKVLRYAGLKEELYLGDFEPDREILARIGVERTPSTVVAVLRAPPKGALYHPFENPLYRRLLQAIAAQPDVRAVVLPRHREQRDALARTGLANCVVPAAAIDARSLMYAADVVVGAGGTMTREAALLGVPTFTIYAGRRPAVDEWLRERGLLRVMRNADELAVLARRERPPAPLERLRERSRALVDVFVGATVAAGR